MAIKRKARLSPLNVAYGVGAAVVITGAMFKFLNWRFANEMLFIGLATEAIVFFISAFELIKDEVDYKWDKVFPQLTTDEPTNIEKLDEMIEKVNLDSNVIERLSDSITRLEQNVARLADASGPVG
jgi:gliding motility-associated protein GldL